MELWIRHALSQYAATQTEAEMHTRWLETFTDPERRQELAFLEMKLSVVHCWLGLLNEDERFVTTTHLIQGIEWPRVVIAYEEKWGAEFAKTERTLRQYQANALAKMVAFAEQHKEVVGALFGDLVGLAEGDVED